MAVNFTPGGVFTILTSDDSVFIGTVNSSNATSVKMQISEDSDPFATGDTVTILINQIIAFSEMEPEV